MFSFENLIDALRANFPWAVAVNVPIAIASYVAGAVRGSGLIAGLACGLVIYSFGGLGAFLILLLFFLAGSIASKIGPARESASGAAADDKAARGAGSVVGKCSVGAALGILMAAAGGRGQAEGPAALLGLAYTGAFAAALADTLASELGPLHGGKAFSLKTLAPVPHGTPGAVSPGGAAFGLAGALLVGLVATFLGLIGAKAIIWLAISSLAAIMLESALRTWQPGTGLLKKQAPNFLLTLIGAAGAVALAVALGR